uniref:Heavy metal-associated isoprenylated plant protein 32 n=2 Tax=Elaeis guineensis var. tenera TaxID=51953 RepID=A0A8N4F174_ELAGV|nr:heavy metal-associated isoprenylated plant protein 32 [Elaeis guineensis]
MHCTACRKKVDQLLHKIEGVEQVDIDAEEKMVTVSGNVDPAILLQTLKKAGNRAELWASEAGKNDDQLKDGKGQQEDNGKPKKGGGGRCKNMKLPHLKGPKFPFGRKDKKSVKFDLPPENSADEERGSDEERDHNEADDIHGDNEDNQNQDDDIDGDDEDNQNQGDDVDDDSEDNQNQGGGGGENGGGNNNKAAQPMLCPYMMAQGFHCMHLGRMGSMPHAPKSHMGNIPAGAVPAGYFHGGMAAPEMSAPSTNPYRQQYMAVMMDQQRMMMSGQTGGAANPPPPNGYGTPYAPRYVDHYTNMFSDENPNACSII